MTKREADMKGRQKRLSTMTASKGHPGLELDAHGKPIPKEDRLPEDRAKMKAARKRAATSQKS
jgi:hypothetical protein